MIKNIFFMLAIIPIFSSSVALLALILGSFEIKKKEDQPHPDEPQFIKRESRTIKINNVVDSAANFPAGLNTQIPSLLWTVILGQAVGLFFLLQFLSDLHTTKTIIKFNGVVLLFASFLCSILTILNGWLKRKMVILFRLLFQGYSFCVAMFLLYSVLVKDIGMQTALARAGFLSYVIIIFYFLTVIIAILLMLLDGILKKHQQIDFNYNIYYLIVIFIGMGIGLGLWISISYI